MPISVSAAQTALETAIRNHETAAFDFDRAQVAFLEAETARKAAAAEAVGTESPFAGFDLDEAIQAVETARRNMDTCAIIRDAAREAMERAQAAVIAAGYAEASQAVRENLTITAEVCAELDGVIAQLGPLVFQADLHDRAARHLASGRLGGHTTVGPSYLRRTLLDKLEAHIHVLRNGLTRDLGPIATTAALRAADEIQRAPHYRKAD